VIFNSGLATLTCSPASLDDVVDLLCQLATFAHAMGCPRWRDDAVMVAEALIRSDLDSGGGRLS
jgi:hypothetical protein